MQTSIWERFRQEGVVVLGINPEEGANVARQFADEFGIEFPVLVDGGGTVYRKYRQDGISPFPLDYIIDQNGVVQYLNTEYRPQEMIRTIGSLLQPTGVTRFPKPERPETYALNQSFPNPIIRAVLAHQGCQISFTLRKESRVTLAIYNLMGEKLITLHSGSLPPGDHTFRWNGRDHFNRRIASGVYLISLQGSRTRKVKKIIVLP